MEKTMISWELRSEKVADEGLKKAEKGASTPFASVEELGVPRCPVSKFGSATGEGQFASYYLK